MYVYIYIYIYIYIHIYIYIYMFRENIINVDGNRSRYVLLMGDVPSKSHLNPHKKGTPLIRINQVFIHPGSRLLSELCINGCEFSESEPPQKWTLRPARFIAK